MTKYSAKKYIFTNLDYSALISGLEEQMNSDNESYGVKGRKVIEAYRNNDPDGMVMALCGWDMDSLTMLAVEGEVY